jgi:hypothetical protein
MNMMSLCGRFRHQQVVLTLLAMGAVAGCTNPPSAGTGAGPTIQHISVADTQPAGQALPAGQDVPIDAMVTDDDGVASATLSYQAPHGSSWTTVSLQIDPARANRYVGQIPAADVNAPGVSYYLGATDRKGNQSTLPAKAPQESFSFTVEGQTGDREGPAFGHVPIANGRPLAMKVDIKATVTDDTGVKSVFCHYRAQGEAEWIDLPMQKGTNEQYQGAIPGSAIVPPGLDYWLEATDTAPAANQSTRPINAPGTFFSFTVSAGDEDPPVIEHTPITDGQPEGRPVAIVAAVTDLTGVADNGVVLFYRVTGVPDWSQIIMTQETSSAPFRTTIPYDQVTSAGVDYYIQAKDSAAMGNAATHPPNAPTDGYHSFTTATETCVVPPIAPESFEGGILPGWWRTFPSGLGCDFEVTSGTAHDGAYVVGHPSPWGESCNDLLVLPCLDLSTPPADGLVFDFWQQQGYGTAQSHTLEYALDSPDPAVSTYTAFAPNLPIEASSGWVHRTVVIPPGAAFMGHDRVYLALRYIGTDADEWSLDQIGIRPPAANLQFAGSQTTPNPIIPGAGDIAVALTLKLQNIGDKASAPLTGTITQSDPGVTITAATGSFGACAPNAEVSATEFRLTIDGSHANGEVPFTLTLSDGTVIPFALYVGIRAIAHVQMTTGDMTYETDVDLFLGTGPDPATANWVTADFTGSTYDDGTFTYDQDISAYTPDLPPSAAHPWILKIVHKWDGICNIEDFSISYGTDVYRYTALPFAAPGCLTSGTDCTDEKRTSYIMLPTPPNPKVDTVTTTPAMLAPGSTGAQLTIKLRNDGWTTDGPLTGRLTPRDQATTDAVGASLDQTTAHTFNGNAPFANGQKGDSDTPWTFNVASTFNAGKPLSFVLTAQDGTSSWQLDVNVPVPAAGMSVYALDLLGTSNGNYLPDAGELVDFMLRLQNTGTLATADRVTGTLTIAAENTASLTIPSGFDSATFGAGPIPPGAAPVTSSNIYRFQLAASPTVAPHQTVVLDLLLTDGTALGTWLRKLVMPIYALVGSDPQSDASTAVVDLRQLYFHVAGGILEARVVGWNGFAAATAQVSVIVAEPASGSGQAYRLRFDAGTLGAATLDATGWTNATTPPSLMVVPVLDTSGSASALVFRVKLAELSGLTLPNAARLGAQADGAGTAVLDYLPDAWSSRLLSDLIAVTW